MVLETVIGMPVRVTGSFQTNVGLRPTTVFFPRLWHGAPGPGGFTYFPIRWQAIKYLMSTDLVRCLLFCCVPHGNATHLNTTPPLQTLIIWRMHVVMVVDPRWLTGCMNVAGSILAAFGVYSLLAARRNEEGLQAEARSRRASSVAAGSLQLRNDGADEERAPASLKQQEREKM